VAPQPLAPFARRGFLAARSRARRAAQVARFDFSCFDDAYHQETLDNLKAACTSVRKLCAVMLDTRGPEITVTKPHDLEIALVAGQTLVLTTDTAVPCSASMLPVSYEGLPSVVKPGDSIFLGQYLFTGSETSSVYLRVISCDERTVTCEARNSATLGGLMLTVHLENVLTRISNLPAHDEAAIRGWGARNAIDFLSLSFTQSAAEVDAARALLAECGLAETQIMAKVENREGLCNIEAIADAADGIILSRGNLGVDLPPEKLFKVQKLAVSVCADRGKPCVITRVLDSMVDAPRPTRAEATDVANAVLDGCDGFLLGAETLRGAFPVETVRVVLSIAHEAERVFNAQRYYKNLNKRTGGALKEFSHVESLASSAVRAADKVAARLILVFTQTGRAARLVAKYRPTVPILSVVVPKLLTDGLHWKFTGLAQARARCNAYAHKCIPVSLASRSCADARQDGDSPRCLPGTRGAGLPQARQSLIVRGLIPVLADPAESFSSLRELSGEEFARYGGGMLGGVVHRAGGMGLVSPGDRVVVVQRIGDDTAIKIVEYSGTATLPQVYSTAEFGTPSTARLAPPHSQAPHGHSFARHASAASSISEDCE
jgi:pyruvate kinase